jgi:YVTN family beta-propeller protein
MVSVIDVASGTWTSTIPVGSSPTGVAFTPDGSTAYVANNEGDTVSVIDVASGTVTSAIPVGWAPDSVAVAPDGSTAYVTNSGSDSVSLIDVASGTVTSTIPVGTPPTGVAVAPDGSTVYVVNTSSNTVSVITVDAAPPVFTADTPPTKATTRTAYSYTFTATGAPAPTFYVSSGALPAGLSLDSSTGVLSGSPTKAGKATFTVTATNGVSPDAVTPRITITVTKGKSR